MIDPAPAHPVCDRDGAALKRASEESYAPRDHDDESEAPKAKPKPKPHKKKAKS